MDRRIRTSLVSIVTDITLITIKGVLASFTGSAALLADAYHSLSDLFVSLAVLAGVGTRSFEESRIKRLGVKESSLNESSPNEFEPEKSDNAEGATISELGENETKNEADTANAKKPSAGYWIEAGIAYVISLIILYLPFEIISGISDKPDYTVKNVWVAIFGVLVCIMIAYFISRFKILVGRDTDSPALVADGYHSRMDMFTSIAVLFSLLGNMIGLKVDGLIAVIIAVMIGITGVELFITSILGFTRKSKLSHISIVEWFAGHLNKVLGYVSEKVFGKRYLLPELGNFDGSFVKKILTLKTISVLLSFMFLAYMSSGFYFIGVDQTGVKTRFGKIIKSDIKPGLAYALPVPFENIRKVSADRVYRLEIGFRTDIDVEVITSTLWETRHSIQGYKKNKKESIMLTGDENIVDFSVVVHYKLLDAVSFMTKVQNVEDVIRGLAESSMREVLSGEMADNVLVDAKMRIIKRIKNLLNKEMDKLDIGVRVLDIYCHDIHPPIEVVTSFRDVFSAREEKAKKLNQAQTYKNESLPKARAESVTRILDAKAFANEKSERSIGDAEKFELVSKAYRIAPNITGYRLFIEMVESTMLGKDKIIADPEANRGGYRMWMFAPNKRSIMETQNR